MADEPTIDSILTGAIAGAAPDAAVLTPGAGASPGEILQAQLRNGELEVLAAPVVKVAAEPVVAAAAKPVVAAEPTLSTEETATAGEFAQGRFRIKDEGDKALIVFARANGLTIAQAAAQMAGTAHVQVEAPVVQPTLPDIIVAKESRLAEIRADLDAQIAESGGVGLTLTAEVRALQKEEADLTRELPVLQVDHKMATAREQRVSQTAFNTEFDKWETAALEEYPDSGTVGTPLHTAIKAEAERLQAEGDPILAMPDCAYLVAARVARQTGYVKPAAAAPVTAAPVVPVTQALPRAIGATPGTVVSEAHRVTVASAELTPLQKFQNMVSGAAGGVQMSMAEALGSLVNGGSPAGAAAMVSRVR
jgi:hypothetical protein